MAPAPAAGGATCGSGLVLADACLKDGGGAGLVKR